MDTHTYHIVLKDGWWTVFRGRSRYPYSVHATEEQALASASLVAETEGARVVFHPHAEQVETSTPVRPISRKLRVLG